MGARRYAKDPTLLTSMSSRVIAMALDALRHEAPAADNVRAFLLLLTWPYPTNSTLKDITYTICGSVMHMAVSLGLHMPISFQDFSRSVIKLSDNEIAKRAQLWAWCVITYQK